VQVCSFIKIPEKKVKNLFFGFFNSMESAFPYEESFSVRPNPVLRRLGRGASPSANPHSFVRKHHAYRPVRASGDPDVVLHCPQSLISSSGSTTPPGPIEPPATGAWCFTIRKACYEVTVVKRRLQERFISRHGTFVFSCQHLERALI